ncbi:MAG: V-type ATPase, D subunit [Thermotoga sp. 50_1627]|uniref:V-type ATP synthase subunit D n=1 Tax=Pseudothermotoga sp. TaxID=2033661 RepID=UPI00076DA5D7|nr:MAG: V-type ATPase [Thermotoga sp. 50_64]KUK25838.1 MAG: V-type ATPase, D subunit [Thermotoga sp. 50_1627]MBC7115523.1 V-type ATP synthase subunit D [Pseudothermotoga sp.]MDK2923981.1 V/A-type H+/Na+-transporting ATPase subunit [Pseudothermotoga sp.]HBT40059.1 V-type ATP synthase subunit D [Pseudothermotoga sp.]
MPLRVNPNRMELLRLKKRLVLARRGHKLLEDKLEGLIQRFLQESKDYIMFREEVESEFLVFLAIGVYARTRIADELWQLLVESSKGSVNLKQRTEKRMNVPVEVLSVEEVSLPVYSLVETPAVLDEIARKWKDLLEKIVELANKERYLIALAMEIERTKRRVNALEYKLIPQLEETIKFIGTKLEELERSNFFRLLRLKE